MDYRNLMCYFFILTLSNVYPAVKTVSKWIEGYVCYLSLVQLAGDNDSIQVSQ